MSARGGSMCQAGAGDAGASDNGPPSVSASMKRNHQGSQRQTAPFRPTPKPPLTDSRRDVPLNHRWDRGLTTSRPSFTRRTPSVS
ncbi:hypothetical protein GY45DRAFT_323439 [Cubamyces sp. BRFM 1775]|nr:hypothetical protein GY45DRAFT_323439 [Cubamyces sp. BRFM 1775]